MSSVKLLLALARKWGVPAKHGDVPNAYVKADKEAELVIYIRVPQGMKISEEIRKKLGVVKDGELALELQKALYGLKQAGRLWSQLLQKKLQGAGFEQSLTDMCVYFRRKKGALVVVGVYVDDLLVTGTRQGEVDNFFGELSDLAVKDLGVASKFLGMRVEYTQENGYYLDQEAGISELLREFGMEHANGVRTPIGAEWNEVDVSELLPTSGGEGVVTVPRFQSLVGSLLWIARCTRPDVAFAVHKATRKAHSPSMADWKLAKRVVRYLAGTKRLRLQMKGNRGSEEALEMVAYSDADFAADKKDRKSVTGGLVTLDGMPVSWICKKQGGVSLSTMEAEYTAASVLGAELLGIWELLKELGVKSELPMPLRVDNQAALKQLDGETTSGEAKHIDVRIKFIGCYTRLGVLKPEYLASECMPADLMTKALDAPRLADLREQLGMF
ncbi:Integrase catalytic core protein [Phytophthora palmivora]|uniref:Integrase catalytic core protein n=1 Tax=Phytophthora palmivora TaxID=4796 RepID=A0A2P4Y2I5_9STRA|nr:Integrase catalytic core protein [Phytophthora palmivora]